MTDRPVSRVAARVRELAATYEPPDFAHVATADAALFLCAIDHKTGFREAHRVEGRGPFEGSELLWELARYEAYSDPLAKKAFLFAKIAERRGWLTVADPDAWQVCADNVLMRLALRSGLVEPGGTEQVRAATRDAFARVAAESGVSPPVLDDLLWERGRHDPDLIGAEAGELREPPRREGVHWY